MNRTTVTAARAEVFGLISTIPHCPLEQWQVGREYRRRLKKAFDAARIEIPFPHRSLLVGETSRPLEVLVRATAAPNSPD